MSTEVELIQTAPPPQPPLRSGSGLGLAGTRLFNQSPPPLACRPSHSPPPQALQQQAFLATSALAEHLVSAVPLDHGL